MPLRQYTFSTKDFCYYTGMVHVTPTTTQEEVIRIAKDALVADLKKLQLTFLAERLEALELHMAPIADVLSSDDVIWLCDHPCHGTSP